MLVHFQPVPLFTVESDFFKRNTLLFIQKKFFPLEFLFALERYVT